MSKILPTLPLVGGLGSTSAHELHPDEGPGAGQARDAGLDAEAAATTNVRELAYEALGPAAGSQGPWCPHGEDLGANCWQCDDEAIAAEGRADVMPAGYLDALAERAKTWPALETRAPIVGCARHGCGLPCPACALESGR